MICALSALVTCISDKPDPGKARQIPQVMMMLVAAQLACYSSLGLEETPLSDSFYDRSVTVTTLARTHTHTDSPLSYGWFSARSLCEDVLVDSSCKGVQGVLGHDVLSFFCLSCWHSDEATRSSSASIRQGVERTVTGGGLAGLSQMYLCRFKMGTGIFISFHCSRSLSDSLSSPVRDTPPYRAILVRDSIAEGGIAPICLVFIGYRASIAEIPLLRGGYRTSTSHALQGGNAQKRGRCIAPIWQS